MLNNFTEFKALFSKNQFKFNKANALIDKFKSKLETLCDVEVKILANDSDAVSQMLEIIHKGDE